MTTLNYMTNLASVKKKKKIKKNLDKKKRQKQLNLVFVIFIFVFISSPAGANCITDWHRTMRWHMGTTYIKCELFPAIRNGVGTSTLKQVPHKDSFQKRAWNRPCPLIIGFL